MSCLAEIASESWSDLLNIEMRRAKLHGSDNDELKVPFKELFLTIEKKELITTMINVSSLTLYTEKVEE